MVAEKDGDVHYLAGYGGIKRRFYMRVILLLSTLVDFMLSVARFSSNFQSYINLNIARLFCDIAEVENKKATQKRWL